MQSARARYAGDHLYLTEAKFDALERARLELSGDVDFSRKSWNFRGKMEGADCEELVSPDWRQRLMGELGSDFRVEKKGAGEPVLSGSLKLTRGVLTALPVLDKIAAYTGALRFRRLVLSDARLDFRKIGERKELRNIVLASEGLVRVTGNIDLEGEEITMGKLRVGITPGTLAHLPGAETKVFLLHEKGLLWTTVNISGNIKKPREDLSERLIAAAGERMFELVPETGEVALRYSNKAVDVATRKLLAKEGILGELGAFYLEDGKKILQKGKKAAREAAEKGAQKAIEGGVKALEKGSGALFDLLGN